MSARPCVVLEERIGARVDPSEFPMIPAAPAPPPAPRTPRDPRDGVTPGDAFAEAVEWADLLVPPPLEWEYVGEDSGQLWRRAAATSEYSARAFEHNLVVHSEAVDELPSGAGQRITKLRLFALLHHGGDASAATKDLIAASRGEPCTEAAAALPDHVLAAVRKAAPSDADQWARLGINVTKITSKINGKSRMNTESDIKGAAAPIHTAPLLPSLPSTSEGVQPVLPSVLPSQTQNAPFGASSETNPSAVTESENPPPRALRLIRASSITPKPVRWAWDTAPADATPAEREGRFPVGSLVIGAGRAGVGKSQACAWCAARITNGTLPGAFYGRPRAVIYCATEDSWEMTLVPRLMASGADLDSVYRVDVHDDENPHARLTLPMDTSLLERAIREYDVAAVILDPLLSLIDAQINDYRAREVREALEPLVAVADRTGALLLGLAHFTKASGNDPLMLISGSGAFGQLVRAAVAFAEDDDEVPDGQAGSNTPTERRFVMSSIKNNLGREDLPSLAYRIVPAKVDTPDGDAWVSRLEFTGEAAGRSVKDILRGAGEDAIERAERHEVDAWLRDALIDAGGCMEAVKIFKAAAAAGYSRDQAKRAKKRLGLGAAKGGLASGWFWSLPEASVIYAPPLTSKGAPPPEGSTEKEPALFEGSTTHTPSDLEESKGAGQRSGFAREAPACAGCGERLLLIRPGRDRCARCVPPPPGSVADAQLAELGLLPPPPDPVRQEPA